MKKLSNTEAELKKALLIAFGTFSTTSLNYSAIRLKITNYIRHDSHLRITVLALQKSFVRLLNLAVYTLLNNEKDLHLGLLCPRYKPFLDLLLFLLTSLYHLSVVHKFLHDFFPYQFSLIGYSAKKITENKAKRCCITDCITDCNNIT